MTQEKALINFVFNKYGEWAYIPETKEIIRLEFRAGTTDTEPDLSDVKHYLFDVQHIGGWVQYEADSIGWEDILEEVMPDIIKEFEERKKPKPLSKSSNWVEELDVALNNINSEDFSYEILTMWIYKGSYDSYTGEYDSDFYMEGFVDMNSIKLRKEKTNDSN